MTDSLPPEKNPATSRMIFWRLMWAWLYAWRNLLVMVLSVVGAVAFYLHHERVMQRPVELEGDQPVLFEIVRGQSLRSVAQTLEQRGLIASRFDFMLQAHGLGVAKQIRAGEYEIVKQDTADTLLQKFVSGKIYLHTFTVVEGVTWKQILEQLRHKDNITSQLKADLSELTKQLDIDHPHPEGWVLPETYAFARGTSDIDVLQRGVAAMKKTLDELWAQRAPNLPLKTPYEALILASIVEKETGQTDERARIAGVFTKRLRLGMPLQTDPTVIYGLGDAFAGNLTRKHLQQDTPFNTYTRRGLPPTPIAMPGRAALQAALQPQESGALYFVARGDGTHQFSATLDEHNAAVRKYQLQKKVKDKP